ncbi:unnamed protein product [Caenorhabditis sp. 36 PRJEB53466]|nr:unnamed protein product [Caenorhabditis sp. 36 PRJEB53466]
MGEDRPRLLGKRDFKVESEDDEVYGQPPQRNQFSSSNSRQEPEASTRNTQRQMPPHPANVAPREPESSLEETSEESVHEEISRVYYGEMHRVINENGGLANILNNIPLAQRILGSNFANVVRFIAPIQVPAFPVPLAMPNLSEDLELQRVRHSHSLLFAALTNVVQADMMLPTMENLEMCSLLTTKINELQRYMNDHANRRNVN